jgi:hypothetical protein
MRALSPSEAVGQAAEIRELVQGLLEQTRIGAAREAAVLKFVSDVVGYVFKSNEDGHSREVAAVEAMGAATAKRAAIEVAAELGQAGDTEGATFIKTLGQVAIAFINRRNDPDGKPGGAKAPPPPPPPGL